MKIIAGPRGTYKTKQLIELAAKDNAYILTTNPYALRQKAKDYGYDNIHFIDVNDLCNGNVDEGIPIYVHKLTDVFEEIYRAAFVDMPEIKGCTITLEEE